MRSLHYARTAKNDLDEIAAYIADQSGNRAAGSNFAANLRKKCRHLATLPGTFGIARPELLPGIRSTPYDAYVIFFRYHEHAVEIVTILHGSRDQTYYFEGE